MTGNHRSKATGLNRRQFLQASAAGAASLSFGALALRSGAALAVNPDYGPLQLANDEITGLPLLALPRGFRYQSYGWTGDLMNAGVATPGSHDGMAMVSSGTDGIVTLVRNHERNAGTPYAPAVYDTTRGGGTTNLRFDTVNGRWLDSWATLSGTVRNCAGGPTPWGSWLSCEETTDGPEDGTADMTHGWVFEVPALDAPTAEPLTALGRFRHEAAAVDPKTGIVYETEDHDASGFYRMLPSQPGNLAAGGELQMLKIQSQDHADLRRGLPANAIWDVEWVPIEHPERAHAPGTRNGAGVYLQGLRLGGATIARGEGCWYDSDRVYFASTSGGDARRGQIFEYDPRAETLRLLYESPNRRVCDSPDNIAVSPRGGLVLCEDGDRDNSLMLGLTRDGLLFPFAENRIVLGGEKNGFVGDFGGSEWAGASFYGRWLFVNIQSPGVTFAITGPWSAGAL